MIRQDLNNCPHDCAGYWIAWAPPASGFTLQHAEHGTLSSLDMPNNVTYGRSKTELRSHTLRHHRHRPLCCIDAFDSRL
jgi:hypothetical protein